MTRLRAHGTLRLARGVHVRDFKLYASQTRSKEALRSRLLKKLRKRQAASS
jgi:hypothetical protein